jgi:predicted amidohydrolase YtcJ
LAEAVEKSPRPIDFLDRQCVDYLDRSQFAVRSFLDAGIQVPGKLADLAVLDRDPTHEYPSCFIQIPVERTMVGGRWVFEV